MRMGFVPLSRSEGSAMTIRTLDAKSTRAGWSPTMMSGSLSTGNPCPRSVTRPPSTARRGATDEMVGRDISKCKVPSAALYTLHFELGLGFVELHVPVQIVAPTLRRVAQPDRDADRRGRIGAPWRPEQPHARLGRRPPPLQAITADAARDDVLPVLAAAIGHGYHVIEGQFRGRER